jgi:hypothetical protein
MLVHDKNRYTYNYQQIILSSRDNLSADGWIFICQLTIRGPLYSRFLYFNLISAL